MPFKDKVKKAEYDRDRRNKYRQIIRLRNNERQRSNRAAYFTGKVCVDCGSTERLELDHIDPRTKVSHRIWGWGKLRREAELVKCTVRCNTCHKLKTKKDMRVLFPIIHGVSTTYDKRKCRCELCKAAKMARQREYRASKRQTL
jgi:hypothetical protein